MKAIACAIMFAAIWHTPLPLWQEFTEASKGFIVAFGAIIWCAFLGCLYGEKS